MKMETGCPVHPKSLWSGFPIALKLPIGKQSPQMKTPSKENKSVVKSERGKETGGKNFGNDQYRG
jgi:hypothetical protein